MGFGESLGTSEVLDARRQGAAIEGNTADDALMVDQGFVGSLTHPGFFCILHSLTNMIRHSWVYLSRHPGRQSLRRPSVLHFLPIQRFFSWFVKEQGKDD